ncbi:MAG: PUA domain-containing protein, partial [Planctomycetota bacterium]
PSDAITDPLRRVLAGEPLGTRFVPGSGGVGARKSWIAHAAAVSGSVVIDDGAAKAVIERGASLLPKGVVRVEGRFQAGSAVDIVDLRGTRIARGLVSYGSDEIARIAGRKSDEIVGVLGYAYADEVVHRNDMRLTGAT